MEKVLQENDRLLTQALSVEIVNIVVHDNVKFDCLNVDACAHCRDTVSSPESAPTFAELFEINDLKAQVQEKDTVILKLKEKINSFCGDDKERKAKREVEEIETQNLELDHKVTKLAAENEHLKHTYKQLFDSIKSSRVQSKEQSLREQLNKLKGKAVLTEAVSLNPIDPALLQRLWQPPVLLKIDPLFAFDTARPLMSFCTVNSLTYHFCMCSVLFAIQQMIVRIWVSYNQKLILESSLVMHRQRKLSKFITGIQDELWKQYISGLVQKSSPSASYVPPSRNDWDLLFQPLFDELLNPPPSVVNQAAEVIAPIAKVIPQVDADSTGSPSLATVDQHAPSQSKSLTPTEIQSSVILQDVENDNLDIEIAHMGNDPLLGVSIPEDHPLNNIISQLSRPVSTRLQLHEQALFCYYDAFLTSVEPKTYKEALTQACWIEAMQEELNEFKHLEVWELILRPDKVMVITLKWIYKVKLDELGGILKNKACLVTRGYRQKEGIDFEESFASDYSVALTTFADADHAGCQDTRRSSAYRKARPCSQKDLSIPLWNRSSGSMVFEGFFCCLNSFCRCGSGWLPRYSPKLGLPKSTYMQSKGSFDTFVEPLIGVYDIRKIFQLLQMQITLVAKILSGVHLEVCSFWEIGLLAGRQKGKRALLFLVRKLNT
nr:integrase, catalytic region, zinc finger, CCHC-type, peptidase aspartic, catalytic [Tanacetum cinerariifolium]